MTTVYPYISTAADLLHSTIRLQQLASFLTQQQTTNAAIVNRNMYGVIPFYEMMRQNNIQPIIGLRVDVELENSNLPIVLYAQNEEGYRHLLKISSAIETKERLTLPLSWLMAYEKGTKIVFLLQENLDEEQVAIWQHNVGNLATQLNSPQFIAISRPGGMKQQYESTIESFAMQMNIPILAMQTCFYLNELDASAFEVAQNIAFGTKLSDVKGFQLPHTKHFVPTKEQWNNWFLDKKQWLNTINEVFQNCEVEIDLKAKHLPKYPLKAGETSKIYLRKLCEQGMKERVPSFTPNYIERLNYELSVIGQMGFEDYFLIVADFMNYAKEKQILTGPGRGSSASSLVAFCLYITHVDPIKFGLLFERFLNPERVTLPDIDIDFLDRRRNEVIQYVATKYGSAHVAQIMTYGTLSAKAVARDVGRVFGFDASLLERVSSFIPSRLGITLQQAYNENGDFSKWIYSNEVHEKWWHACLALEGLPKHVSTHAAGVILSPMPLVDIVPVQQGHEGIYLTQWPMKEVEQIGLLKMDFLGLRNLALLEKIRRLIWQDQQKWLDFEKIPLDDSKTLQLLRAGDTLGVFQFESDGMRRTLKEIQPTSFLDIVAINALYRPGPADNIPMFSRRKKGEEEVRYQHSILQPILQETYGIIVYQEQIMQIASKVAAFTFGQADLLRRAVSKKNRELLEQQRKAFVNGANNNKFPIEVANELFDLIVQFANYGFPKSHAVAYSMIAFHLAYLKANYPLYFFAALLSSISGNMDKYYEIQSEMKRYNVQIVNPCINRSSYSFHVEGNVIRYGLANIKGLSSSFVKAVLEARKSKVEGFSDIFDFALILQEGQFQKKNMEILIQSGALDVFGYNRATLVETLDAASKYADLARPTEQSDLFTNVQQAFGKPKHNKVNDWSELEKLQFEKEVLGMYLSSHPVEEWRKKYEQNFTLLYEVDGKLPNLLCVVCGIVKEIKVIRTKKGEQMSFFMLEDETSQISCTLFPKEFLQYNELLQNGVIAMFEGKMDLRQGNRQLIIQKCII